jgi:XRE family transcriptional regulator, fatty acid utilization regulator
MALSSNFTHDALVFGQRLRHLRRARGLTLAQLGRRVDRSAPYLSQLENGRREPTLSLVNELAGVFGIAAAELLSSEPPSRRAELEVAVQRAQDDPLYRDLGLPRLVPSTRLPDTALEHIVRLYAELKSRQQVRAATPEEARKANAALRAEMRERDNYFADIEALAREALAAVGHRGRGPLSPRTLTEIASHYGFTVEAVDDLPSTVRSLTDLRHRRIYIPQRNELGTQLARSVVFQTLGHILLDHEVPRDFAEFLRQRVEANYFAGAVLLPEPAAVEFLTEALNDHDVSLEDFAEQFYVSYEMAAHRFTNLATQHLGIPVHFVRSDEQGVIWKAYENDGVPFPADPDGAIEGQRLCRHWGTRQVFHAARRYAMHYQYTDTPSGTFWCATYLEGGREPQHAVTVGVPFAHAKHFRGRDTRTRAASACPDGPCCRRPHEDLAARWRGQAWPSPRPHSHVLAALPAGTFPGVDLTEAYEFLDRHTAESDARG